MKNPQNYTFTQAKIRTERSARVKATLTTLAWTLTPAAIGSTVHVGWAIGLAIVGFGVDYVFLRSHAQ